MENINVSTINLKVLRTRNRCSQKDVSKILNLSTVQYSKKENGKAIFTIIEAKKLSDYFKLSIDDIFFGNIVY